MICLAAVLAFQSAFPGDYRKDLHELVTSLDQYGAYVRSDHIDCNQMEASYAAKFSSVKDRDELIADLEMLMGELHDFHASLGTNNDASPRLVPSGTDVVGSWWDLHAFIDQVRIGSLAEKAGLASGDEILKIGNKTTVDAARSWLHLSPPKGPPEHSGWHPIDPSTQRAWNWALNSALAGPGTLSDRY